MKNILDVTESMICSVVERSFPSMLPGKIDDGSGAIFPPYDEGRAELTIAEIGLADVQIIIAVVVEIEVYGAVPFVGDRKSVV